MAAQGPADPSAVVGYLCIAWLACTPSLSEQLEQARAAGAPVLEMPIVDPEHLAGLLWAMHRTKGQREAIYP
jgi:hypothetical protein